MAGMKSGIKSSIIFGLILSLGLTLSGGMQVKAAGDKKADKKATIFIQMIAFSHCFFM